MSYECNICHKKFKKNIYLRNHINKNICEKYNKLPYGCNHCEKRYSLKRTLSIHLKSKHNNKNSENNKNIKCTLCYKDFSSKSNLNKHLALARCHMIKNKASNISITNNNDNSINIQNNINIKINFGREKLDDWIDIVGNKIINKCIRNLQGLPSNLLEAKHVLVKQNRNIYLPSEEDKYKDINIFSDGWKQLSTSLILDKMLVNISNDIYDIIQNDKKYKLRLSKKLKDELDKKITVIQKDPYQKGPVINMLLKNKDVLSEHFNETQEEI